MGLAKYYEDNCEIRENNILMSFWKNEPIALHSSSDSKSYKSSFRGQKHGSGKATKPISHNGKSGKRAANACPSSNASHTNQLVYIPQLGVGTVIYTSGNTCKLEFANTVRYCSPQKLQKYMIQACYSGSR